MRNARKTFVLQAMIPAPLDRDIRDPSFYEVAELVFNGPVSFFWRRRLFVIARKHLPGPDIRKRTALYAITGRFDGGPIAISEWGELPSAGDTSYAGAASVSRGRLLATWYSSPPELDESWVDGFFGHTTSGRRTSCRPR